MCCPQILLDCHLIWTWSIREHGNACDHYLTHTYIGHHWTTCLQSCGSLSHHTLQVRGLVSARATSFQIAMSLHVSSWFSMFLHVSPCFSMFLVSPAGIRPKSALLQLLQGGPELCVVGSDTDNPMRNKCIDFILIHQSV